MLRWLKAYEDVAAKHGKVVSGRSPTRKPTVHRDAQGRKFKLGAEHAAVWGVLVILAKDVTVDQTDVWQSLPTIAYYSGVGGDTLNDVLADLVSVGLIRRQPRPGKRNTTITHLFALPIQPGENWEDREPVKLFLEGTEEEEETEEQQEKEEEPAVKRPPEAVPDHLKESILAAILEAFDAPPCLAAVRDQERLVRLFPEFAATVGSPMRLLALFMCISDDETPRGIKIKKEFQQAKSAGPYIRVWLRSWPNWYKQEIDSFLESLEEDGE